MNWKFKAGLYTANARPISARAMIRHARTEMSSRISSEISEARDCWPERLRTFMMSAGKLSHSESRCWFASSTCSAGITSVVIGVRGRTGVIDKVVGGQSCLDGFKSAGHLLQFEESCQVGSDPRVREIQRTLLNAVVVLHKAQDAAEIQTVIINS